MKPEILKNWKPAARPRPRRFSGFQISRLPLAPPRGPAPTAPLPAAPQEPNTGPAGNLAGFFFYVCAKTSCPDEIVHALGMYAPQLSGLPNLRDETSGAPPQESGHVLGLF